MKDSEEALMWSLRAMLVIGIAALAFACGRDWMKDEAIEAGVAHWSCDPQTGEKTFVWEAPKQ